MPHDTNCIFCKIVAGEVPAAKILETDCAIAFLDIAPVAPGHTLLVVKEHYATLADTPPQLVANVASELPRLCRAIFAATAAPGLNVVQNNGRDAGQLVAHLHFHLIPRSPRDAVSVHWPHGKYEDNAMEDMRSRIAATL